MDCWQPGTIDGPGLHFCTAMVSCGRGAHTFLGGVCGHPLPTTSSHLSYLPAQAGPAVPHATATPCVLAQCQDQGQSSRRTGALADQSLWDRASQDSRMDMYKPRKLSDTVSRAPELSKDTADLSRSLSGHVFWEVPRKSGTSPHVPLL